MNLDMHNSYLRLLGAILLLFFFSQNSNAQLKTWTGNTDSDWSTGSNWDPAGVPTSANDILIPAVANDPVATGIQIDIASGITLTVEAGAVLTIDGQNAVADGIHNLGTLANNGTIDISNTMDDAIQTEGTMTNNSGGEIIINGTNYGLYQYSGGVLTNDGVIKIGETASLTNQAILNSPSSDGFQNNACALVHVFSDNYISDFSNNFTNDGTITENSASNSDVETNNGIVYNLNGGTFTVTTGNAPVTTIPTTYTWTGANGVDWFEGCNWDSGLVPDESTLVGIPDVANDPQINVPGAAATKVTVNAGAQLNVFFGGNLTINGHRTSDHCLLNSGVVALSGGTITVDSSTLDAIVNTGNSFFFNFGTVNVGGISIDGDIGNAGIWLNNVGSSFQNSGTLNIKGTGRSTAEFGRGIAVQDGFFTNDNGLIFIDGTASEGIWVTSGGTFQNTSGFLGIGQNGPIGKHGIYSEATFTNMASIDIQSSGHDGIRCRLGGSFLNDGGNIIIANCTNSNVAATDPGSTFTNTNNGKLDLSNAGHNNVYLRQSTITNEAGGSIKGGSAGRGLLRLVFSGDFTNSACSSIIGEGTVEIETGTTINNTGYVGADTLILDGTFNNTNGFAFIDKVPTLCLASGGTCLTSPITHVQFISDNDNDGTTFCEGDTDDLNCSTSTQHLVSNTMDDGIGSLRWAIACASPGDTVVFSPATDGQLIQLSSGQIVINKNLTLIGNGMDVTIIDGSLDDANRLFEVNNGALVKFRDLNLQHGGGINLSANGGCISIGGNADVQLTSCRIANNMTTAIGGSFFIIDSDLTAVNCIIHDNDADVVAVLWSQGTSDVNIDQCLIFGNTATNQRIFNFLSGGTAAIRQSTIAGNDANGALVILTQVDLLLYNNIITGNNGQDVGTQLTGMVTAFSNLIGSGVTPGTNGNITGNPFFVDPANGDFNLMLSSPCISTADNALLPIDACDLDEDANTAEPIDIDLAGNQRIENGTVDMGALEGLLTTLTFRVDMNKETVSPDGVFVAGNFMTEAEFLNDWEPNVIQLSDVNGDGIYEVQIDIFAPAGTPFEYKYLNGINGWESVPVECAVNTDGFDNRGFFTNAPVLLLPVNCFNECGPCNDMCSMATDIACGETVTGSTNGADNEFGLICGGFDLGNAGGAWYKVTGNGGIITVSLEGSDYDTQLGIFTGDCNSLNCLHANDDFFSLQSKLSFPSESGLDYYIYVTGFAIEEGNYQLSVNCGPECPMDLVLDNSFGSLGGTFEAQNSITLSSTEIQPGSQVILSAPEVNLPTNVDVLFGGALETNSAGCVE